MFRSVADLYIVLFDRIRADPEGTPNGREGYYFGASGEHNLYDVCKKIAEVLVQKGKGKSPEPTTFTQADLDKYFGRGEILIYYVSYNSCDANWVSLRSQRILARTLAARRSVRCPLDGSRRRRRRTS